MGQSGGEASTSLERRGIWQRLQPWCLGLLTILALLLWAAERASRQKPLVLSLPGWTGWSDLRASQGQMALLREREFPNNSAIVRRPVPPAVRRQFNTPILMYVDVDWTDKASGLRVADMRVVQIKLLPLAALFAAWPAIWLLFRAFRGRKESARGFEVLRP